MKSAGDVTNADVMTREDGKSRGCGLVTFGSEEDAANAIETLNETELCERMIFVREDGGGKGKGKGGPERGRDNDRGGRGARFEPYDRGDRGGKGKKGGKGGKGGKKSEANLDDDLDSYMKGEKSGGGGGDGDGGGGDGEGGEGLGGGGEGLGGNGDGDGGGGLGGGTDGGGGEGGGGALGGEGHSSILFALPTNSKLRPEPAVLTERVTSNFEKFLKKNETAFDLIGSVRPFGSVGLSPPTPATDEQNFPELMEPPASTSWAPPLLMLTVVTVVNPVGLTTPGPSETA